jgi:hypothetical protein
MAGRTASAAFLLAVLLPTGAMATAQGVTAMSRWAAMDKCSAAAQKAFPDNTVEAIAKRDAALRQCLAGGNLPPRDTQSLPSAAKP